MLMKCFHTSQKLTCLGVTASLLAISTGEAGCGGGRGSRSQPEADTAADGEGEKGCTSDGKIGFRIEDFCIQVQTCPLAPYRWPPLMSGRSTTARRIGRQIIYDMMFWLSLTEARFSDLRHACAYRTPWRRRTTCWSDAARCSRRSPPRAPPASWRARPTPGELQLLDLNA